MRTTTLYLLAGPKTFRRASKTLFRERNKKTTGYGGNLQNWEVGLRRIITSDGWSSLIENKLKYFLQTGDLTIFTDEELNTIRILIQRDQSGAEALIVSYECDFRDYRKLFINNIKPHVYVGLKLFVEIWKEKAKEHGLAVGDGDIDKLNCTAIEHLKANPHWKSLDKLIKSSDNWSLQERYYYLAKQTCHCMDKETEVLTKRGWISIETLYNNPEEIAVFSQKREIFFEKPSAMNGYYHSGGMITFNGKQVNQFVTPNHKMVYHSNNTLYVKEARDLYRHKNPKIPTAGNYVGGSTNLKDWQIKLLVAIQADAEILNDNSVKFRFAKERKVKRLMEIIREGNLKYKYYDFVEATSSENIVSSIVIHNVGEIISLFRGDKKWNSWLLDFSRNNLELFVDELSFWDGSYTVSYCHKREDYCSKYK